MNEKDTIRFISDGFEKAKAGDALKVFTEVAAIQDQGILPKKSHYPFGWIIYYALHQSPHNEILERKRMLLRYLALDVEKPHKLHSMILTEAIRLYKDSMDVAFSKRGAELNSADRFSLTAFSERWDLDNLRPGDWKRKEVEGKILPSTVEKLISSCVDELAAAGETLSGKFKAVVESAMVAYPDSVNLLAQRAQLHVLAGERKEAIGRLKSAILMSPVKFFLWGRLAELAEGEENRRLRIALLYKGFSCPGQEEFKGKLRLRLASELIAAEAYPLALWELENIKSVYEANGWHLPAKAREIDKKIPVGTQPMDPSAAYRKVEHLAEDFLYEGLPETIVKKTFHKSADEIGNRYGNRKAKMAAWRVTDADGNNYWFNPARHHINENLPNGTELRAIIHNGKIVKAIL